MSAREREGVMPLDVSGWSRFNADWKHPAWWGMLGLIAIAATTVVGFIVGFFYLWIVNVAEDRMGWPPEGTALPPVLFPGLDLIPLALCMLAMLFGSAALKRDRLRPFAASMAVCCVSGLVLLYLRWRQFEALPFGPGENAFASFVWTLTGFHVFLVAGALLPTLAIAWLAFRGYFTSHRRIGVQIDAMYWTLVALSWPPIYVALYGMPRWIR